MKRLVFFVVLYFVKLVASENVFISDEQVSRSINIDDSFLTLPDLSSSWIKEIRKYRRKLRQDLTESLMKQIAFDDNGNLLPGQKICLPLIARNDIKDEAVRTRRSAPPSTSMYSTDPKQFVVRAVRTIVKGDYKNLLELDPQKSAPPVPDKTWNLNYSHENNTFIDLGNEFEIYNESFTIVSLIRLRPQNSTKPSINRGARILSKRSSHGNGWEFVAPSYYGQTISFYVNEFPGHMDYGKSTLPDNVWIAVGIVVDRDTYSNNVALVTPYIDGMPDGSGTFVEINGNLTSEAPLTVGHARDEYNVINEGRRDYRLPGHPRFNSHFQGDIQTIKIWKSALSRQHMRKISNVLLRSVGKRNAPCPEGYQELDCKCYKLFEHLRSYQSAFDICIREGGNLAMPKTKRIQDFLEILMQQSNKWNFWIGLDDRKTENVKQWCDGNICDYVDKSTFTKFPNGKPDKQYHTEDCVEELKSKMEFTWNDENCLKLNAFLCEVTSQKRSCKN